MSEIKSNCPAPSGAFKEAVCIDAGRVYDSCCDRDCLEDLRCYFSPNNQDIINNALSVRVKSAEVLNVYVDVEPVSFNHGFYACDMTFFFLLEFDVFTAPRSCPKTIKGIAFHEKKVILYGSEGSVKTFSNEITLEDNLDIQSLPSNNMPRCNVQCVDPIALDAKICELKDCFENVRCMPACVCNCVGGTVDVSCPVGTPTVYVTLGLFSIVQLIRNVQMLVPVYDFCIPEKQCDNTTDDPCDVFKKIQFPTDDFFPPRPCNIDSSNCGCADNCAGEMHQ
ncbi:MAG: hypothetical protein Q4B04_03625 [bacterium]|nr:hypothetical protein [bacterium]